MVATNYNNDTYFSVKTDAGRTTIMYTEISAVTVKLTDDGIDEIFQYDIHMKSGTIFTTREQYDTQSELNWHSKWLEMHTIRVKEEIYG